MVKLLILFILFTALTSNVFVFAEHTQKTKEGEIHGMPPWCCSTRDCYAADVRLLEYKAKWPKVRVGEKVYEVMGGGGDGRRGIFVAPGNETFICPMFGKFVRCVLVKPAGGF